MAQILESEITKSKRWCEHSFLILSVGLIPQDHNTPWCEMVCLEFSAFGNFTCFLRVEHTWEGLRDGKTCWLPSLPAGSRWNTHVFHQASGVDVLRSPLKPRMVFLSSDTLGFQSLSYFWTPSLEQCSFLCSPEPFWVRPWGTVCSSLGLLLPKRIPSSHLYAQASGAGGDPGLPVRVSSSLTSIHSNSSFSDPLNLSGGSSALNAPLVQMLELLKYPDVVLLHTPLSLSQGQTFSSLGAGIGKTSSDWTLIIPDLFVLPLDLSLWHSKAKDLTLLFSSPKSQPCPKAMDVSKPLSGKRDIA